MLENYSKQGGLDKVEEKIYYKSYDKEHWGKEGVFRCTEKWVGLPGGGFLKLVWSETKKKWVKKGAVAMEEYVRKTWPDCPRCGGVQEVPAKEGWTYTCAECGSKNEIYPEWVATECQEVNK